MLRFHEIEEKPSALFYGTVIAIVFLVPYTLFLIFISRVYLKTRFSKMERKCEMSLIVGSGLCVSAIIFASLMAPLIPWTDYIFKLNQFKSA